MSTLGRLALLAAMILAVISLTWLFRQEEPRSFVSNPDPAARRDLLGSADVGNGPDLPAYDIILYNGAATAGSEDPTAGLDQSLSSAQQAALRDGLRRKAEIKECDLGGRRPDLVLWGQRAGQANPDSYSVYLDDRLIYPGSYLEAWKLQARGESILCYHIAEETAALLGGL